MTTANNFVVLKCLQCGANLEVYSDTDTFACGYCGTQMTVKRRGGTVALTAVTDAIGRVQKGTDKSAAELTIARLRTEIADLTAERKALADHRRSDGLVFSVLGVMPGLVSLYLLTIPAWFFLLLAGLFGLLAFGLLAFGFQEAQKVTRRIRAVDEQIEERRQRIADLKAVADS